LAQAWTTRLAQFANASLGRLSTIVEVPAEAPDEDQRSEVKVALPGRSDRTVACRCGIAGIAYQIMPFVHGDLAGEVDRRL
jgi:hypothetical protein